MTEKINVFLAQEKVSPKHNDSFWYDGHIATLSYKKRIVKIYAVGEIRIYTSKNGGELVHDGWKSRNSGIELENDDDLNKIGSNYDDEFYWENNNWFDFVFGYDNNDDIDSVFGQVAHEYDSAIEMAKEWLKDEDWWKENLVRYKIETES